MPRSSLASAQVALLRGINVGGKNKLPMRELQALFEAQGARGVSTYIQSGNVLFSATLAAAARTVRRVEAALSERFGQPMPVLLRSADELAAVLVKNPFLAAGAPAASLHVAFLEREPSAASVAKLDPARSPPDAFFVSGREVFLSYPNGAGRTKLGNDYLERCLGCPSTTRNLRTVTALVERSRGGPSRANDEGC